MPCHVLNNTKKTRVSVTTHFTPHIDPLVSVGHSRDKVLFSITRLQPTPPFSRMGCLNLTGTLKCPGLYLKSSLSSVAHNDAELSIKDMKQDGLSVFSSLRGSSAAISPVPGEWDEAPGRKGCTEQCCSKGGQPPPLLPASLRQMDGKLQPPLAVCRNFPRKQLPASCQRHSRRRERSCSMQPEP